MNRIASGKRKLPVMGHQRIGQDIDRDSTPPSMTVGKAHEIVE
ncbi:MULTISPECIES: hypothetical protein [Acidiphilium]|nr:MULTISPECIES: hypothetical protein [Acidiphilium]